MKKLIALITALVMICAIGTVAVSADDVSVFVTIANGEVVAAEEITVTDVDSDGKLTVNDVLTIIHAEKKEGGFEAKSGEFGLFITKLWGVETSNVGYTVNNALAMSLTDEVKNGDYVAAYIFTDPACSDKYSYFDSVRLSEKSGEEFTLTLSGLGYDENWQTVVAPISGADIYVDGVKTSYKTDENGKVTLSLSEGGRHTISAKSESVLLVPAVCEVTVTSVAPKTGDSTPIALAVSTLVLAAVSVSVGIRRRNNNEE